LVLFLLSLPLVVAAQAVAGSPVDAAKLTASTPTVVTEIDLGKLKGAPARLSWSPDGNELYLQIREGDDPARQKVRHYLVELDGKTKSVDDEPPWASQYWTWKSGQSAPSALPSLKIEVRREERLQSSTARPMGGDLARGVPDAGPGGVSATEVESAAQQTQKVIVHSLWLKGESLGEWVNQPVLPGQTFGWAPRAFDAIAFVNRDGQLVFMDAQGRKQQVRDTSDALFPAWRDDGARLAFLERAGRKKLVLKTVDVSRP
jgi:hypothetical protein